MQAWHVNCIAVARVRPAIHAAMATTYPAVPAVGQAQGGRDFSKRPSVSMANALATQMSGLRVTQGPAAVRSVKGGSPGAAVLHCALRVVGRELFSVASLSLSDDSAVLPDSAGGFASGCRPVSGLFIFAVGAAFF